MTSTFMAGALGLPLLFGPIAMAGPALAQDTTPSTTLSSEVSARGDATKTSRSVAPSRARAPHKFGTVSYNKWYARNYMQYKYGWGDNQFKSLVKLWTRESGWSQHAHNGSSGAHGIPQALPGSKMASSGANWRGNPDTQIKWGLSYIKGRYGTPNGAWNASQRKGWY